MDLKITEFKESDYPRKYGETDSRGRYRRNRRASDRPDGHSIVYVSIKGESFWENFADRTSRPHTLWRPLVLQALTEARVQFTSIRWSQKAGCSCPCSPGFIIQGGSYPAKDYWLTIEATERQTVDGEESDRRLSHLLADATIPR